MSDSPSISASPLVAPPAEDAPASESDTLPRTLRERAFALYCSGLRSPAISERLGVPQRTIRSWISTAIENLTNSRSSNLLAYACIAEERQLQIAAAAWDAYYRLAAFEELQLAYLQNGTHEEFTAHPPRITAAGARYLALAMNATREASKLQGAYKCPPAPPPVPVVKFTMAYSHPSHISPPPDQPNLSGPALEIYQQEQYIEGLEAQCESDQFQLSDARVRLAELRAAAASASSAAPPDQPTDPTAASRFAAETATAGAPPSPSGFDPPIAPAPVADSGEPSSSSAEVAATSATTPDADAQFAAKTATATATSPQGFPP